MGTFTDLAQLFQQGWGWVFVLIVAIYGLAWITWQLYAPTLLDKDTALAPIVRDVPDKVDSLQEEQTEMRDDLNNVQGQMDEVQDHQERLTDVTVAQSHMLNGYEGDMDVARVKERLRKGEEDPRDYLEDDLEDTDD